MKYLVILLFIVGCGGKAVTKTVETIVEVESTKLTMSREYVAKSTYWNIPQYYGVNNDVPKYTGVGTYTNKHIPVAYKANGDIYHTFTELADGNFYVYVMKNNQEKVLVHGLIGWDDPHTNAAIHVLESGIVHVHIASRGLSQKFQSGKILASKTPYELDFECIDGCENINIEAYPQVWEASWGEHVGYTHYIKDADYHASRNVRSLWYRVGGVRTNLVKGGHYAISYYDSEYLYVAYNSHINAGADDRVNLYLIKTNDGINWVNNDNEALTLPLEPFDDVSLIYKSEGLVYLKDITVEDGVKVLFVESETKNPTQGQRFTKEFTKDGVKVITESNHNYSGGAYIGGNIVLTNDGLSGGFAGGDLVLYKNYIEIDRDNSSNCHYPRKIINSNDQAVVSCENFHLNDTASHYILTID